MSSGFAYTSQPGGTAESAGVQPVVGGLYTAGQNLTSGVIVRLSQGLLYPADPTDNVPQAHSILGMTAQTIYQGAMGYVVQSGPVSGFSNLSTSCVYFLGSQGQPSAVPAASGWYLTIGTASDPQTYNVKIGEPVYRP